MALTHIVALRNTWADAVDDEINAGTTDAGGDLQILDGAVVAVTITFQNPAFGAAASGVITLAGTPLNNTASAAVTDADNFKIRDRDNGDVITGTVTGSGGGGDIELSNTNIANGQTVEITSMTWTAPA